MYTHTHTHMHSHILSCSVLSNSMTPLTVAHQAPLSMGFPRQKYWSGLLFPPTEDLPSPGIKPISPAPPTLAGRFFTTETPGKPYMYAAAAAAAAKSLQSCPTLRNPIGSSPKLFVCLY